MSLDVCDTEPVKSILKKCLISINSDMMYHDVHDENKNGKSEMSSLFDTLLKSLNNVHGENGNNQINNNHVYDERI